METAAQQFTKLTGLPLQRQEDYTDREIVEIYHNNKALGLLVDFECAHAGIPLLPELPPKPEQPDIKMDAVAYEFKNFTLSSKALADRIIDLLKNADFVEIPYNRKCGEIKKFDERYNSSYEIRPFFSMGLYRKHEKELENFEKLKRERQIAESEYNEVNEKHGKIVKTISDRAKDAIKEQHRLEGIRRTLLRYVSLANGDVDVAMNFLENAHPDSIETARENREKWVEERIAERLTEGAAADFRGIGAEAGSQLLEVA